MTATDEELATIHAVTANFDAIFTWDYKRSRPALGKLYEKAKTSQWNASTDLDWSIDVDPEKIGRELGGGGTARFQALAEAEDSPVKHFGDKEWNQVSIETPELHAVAVHARRAGRAASAPRASSRPCRGSTPSTTRRRRWSTKPATSKCSRATSTRSSARSTASTTTCAASSTRSCATRAGTSRTSACRSWSRASRSPRSG